MDIPADEGPGSGFPDPEEPDGATPTTRSCNTEDNSLRLCIDFDDAPSPTTDGSRFEHPVTSLAVATMPRDTETAGQLSVQSKLWVNESPDLDIDENLTVSLWFDVELGGLSITQNGRWLFDNNNQYYASLRPDLRIRCGSQSIYVDSPSFDVMNGWHHVACSYEPDMVKVYVDGDVASCRKTNERDIPTSGDDGLAVGANLNGVNQGPGGSSPMVSDHFIGGLDNFQVFARTWTDAEICSAAGRITCRTSCPDS